MLMMGVNPETTLDFEGMTHLNLLINSQKQNDRFACLKIQSALGQSLSIYRSDKHTNSTHTHSYICRGRLPAQMCKILKSE